MFAICPLSQIPVRVSANETSEMVSQVLFGEMVEILEKRGKNWLKVRCTWDNLVGWCQTNQLEVLTTKEAALSSEDSAIVMDLCPPIMADNHSFPITLGAKLPAYDGLRCRIGDAYYHFNGQAVMQQDLKKDIDFLTKMAKRYLFAPQYIGGRSTFGLDSAGFVQMTFGFVGLKLPRTPGEQILEGSDVDFVDQSQIGDLAFFENKKGQIAHVGIILEDQMLIHCHGRVKIDRFDHFGVFDGKGRRYSHKLRLIKRVFTFAAKR
ncbi:MAG: NlpC/P60 family protein [Saprospiraceae bacterium]